ncbi:MAG TPA: metallophosphoesterase [Verrucomicrobiae bacterium]|nr:metallophosphoesterase [Verrucomicrobiae bacterium]
MDYWIHIVGRNLVVVLDIAWWIIALRLAKKPVWRALINIFMAAQLGAAILGAVNVDLSLYIPTAMLTAIVVWHFFGLTTFAGAALFYLCVRLIRRNRLRIEAFDRTPASGQSSPVVAENSISRRNFIEACAALVPPLCTFSITGIALKQLDEFRLRRFTLSLPSLPKPLDGLTIAHVSDMHVGQWTHGPILKKIVNRTNALGADLVVVTGDLINYELSDLSESIALLKQMHGRYGLYMVEGNHDLLENGAEFEQRVKQSGLPLLVDESVVREVRGYPVQFLGLRWMDCVGSPDDHITSWQVRELVKQREPEAFPIFLAHHPHAFDPAVEHGLPLTLTGHTHGGQIMLDRNIGVGPVLFRYWSGFYQRGESQLIVSNGVGNMFPVRINAPAEIVHITLKCA